MILLDDGTGKLAPHAADGADFDDPDWMKHLGGDATPATTRRGARTTSETRRISEPRSTESGRPSWRLAEPDDERRRSAAEHLGQDPDLAADGRTLQEKIGQYSLALAL